jgi:hypothetical protein
VRGAVRVSPRARALALALTLAVLPARAALGLQRADFRLPGQLLRGAAGGGRAWLLVGGEGEAPRQLIELRPPGAGEPLVTIATGLPSTVDRLVVPPAAGAVTTPFLVQGGRVLALEPGADGGRREVYHGIGTLLPGPARRRFVAAPPWLAFARAGEVRPLAAASERLTAGEPQALPVTASLERWGLRLASPEASFSGGWLAVGPQQEGVRLRTVLVAASGERRELTSELPEPEQVAESTVVSLDGRPTLVVGTFRGLGLMSRKLLRVFALVGEAGSAPRRPLLSRELPARAWQDLEVIAGDFDRDGRDDLMLAAADGLTESEVKVTMFRGLGGGRLRAEPTTVAFPVKKRTWRFGADVDGDGLPDLVTLGGGRVDVHLGSAPTGFPAKKPSFTIKVDGTEADARRTKEVSVGTGGAYAGESRAEQQPRPAATPAEGAAEQPSLPPPDWELVDVDGDGKAELLWWAPEKDGRETKLIVLRF